MTRDAFAQLIFYVPWAVFLLVVFWLLERGRGRGEPCSATCEQ
jgi:hypothetical protein